MNVTALIHSSQSGLPQAAPYFRMFPREPLAHPDEWATVSSIIEVPNWTLQNLLDRMAHLSRGSNVMIVTHASSGGIMIDLGGSVAGLGRDSIGALERGESGNLGLRPAAVQALNSRAREVRSRSLGNIVIRGCKLGENAGTLDLLRTFFGASAISAPDLYDFYGSANPGSLESEGNLPDGEWTSWLRDHSGAVFNRTREPGLRCAVEIKDSHQVNMVADNRGAVAAWVRDHLPAGHYSGRGRFPVHALINGQVVFPNQAEYRHHLRRSPST